MKKVAPSQISSISSVLIAATLVLLPFHALLTVWAGSNFGHYEAFRLWIEVLLVPLALLTVYAGWKDIAIRALFRRDKLVLVSLAYILWQVLLGLYALQAGWVNGAALLTGWATDLRFVAFMLICWVIATQRPWLVWQWRRLLLIPAGVVVAFGALQAWVLSPDILRHFGYGSDTIAPYTTVDAKATYIRVQSTLRGPNPFGAYLVLPITALVAYVVRGMRKERELATFIFLAVACVALGATYSRSAYIGAVLSVAYICWLSLPSRRAKKWLLAVFAAAVLVAGATALVLRHNDTFENTFFHTDEHSQSSQSSNEVRSSALQQGAKDMFEHPLGSGPGSAGPASVRNNNPARIAENYYLQVGQETGWIGLGLFVAINVLLVMRIWQRRGRQLAVILLASFVGITFINMLSHAWADDTLGMLWWGFAGIALSLPPPAQQGAKIAKVTRARNKKKAAA
jgi:O-antigen ligase